MSRNIGTRLLAYVAVCASTVLASAQTMSTPTDWAQQPSSAPVAYIYVTSYPGSGQFQMNGYAAASNGALTPISGTPFSTASYDIAANGDWLFGTDGNNLFSYSIAANGSVTLKDTLTVELTGGLGSLFLDHTGSTLYVDYYTTNNEEQAYSIDNSTGQLTYLDDIDAGPGFGYVESFISDNEYAYESTCYHFGPSIYGIQRSGDGAINMLTVNQLFPAAPSGDFYCPWSAAADPTNHLALAVQLLDGNFTPLGPYQMASYTVDSAGQLSTTSTYKNMPTTAAGGAAGSNTSYVNQFWMSPSGKLLAVAGTGGLQVFHFNGADPVTKYTKLLVTGMVDEAFWDNANHLYAISGTANKLWVFTVTPTSVKQAPGSPYTITGPENMVVLPK
jgi:hypothetical protein